MSKTFKAFSVSETESGFAGEITERKIEDLPAGDVLVRVKYSSLNYKDALSASGNRGVTRKYPHTPGIDAAGVVEESASADFAPGDEVIVTSYDLGMNTSGGMAQYIRVPAGWVIPLPGGLTLQESMALGTAGLTAGMSLFLLERHGLRPGSGPVLVTGATGGVGCTAVAILSRAGYEVAAVTGKADKADFLRGLGAAEVLGRDEIGAGEKRPILKSRWAGAIDTVGGEYLAAAIKGLAPGGAAACCGLVASPELSLSVFPFILRGAALLGVDSAEFPMENRKKIWQKLASEWKPAPEIMDMIHSEHRLEDLPALISKILKGGMAGRAVIATD